MKHQIAAVIEPPGGHPIPFGPDEPDERRIIDATGSTAIPGGYGIGSLVVPRIDGVDYSTIPLHSDVVMSGPGGKSVYEGRVTATPKNSGESVVIELEGHSAAMTDDLFRQFYVSSDLGRWVAPGLDRQIALADDYDSPHQADAQSLTDENGTGLRLAITGSWTTPKPTCEVWIDAGSGLTLGRLVGRFDGVDDPFSVFALIPFTGDNDADAPTTMADLYAGVADDFDLTFAPARFAGFAWQPTGSGGAANTEYGINLRGLTAVGAQGLPLYVTDEGGLGVRPADLLRHALTIACPQYDLDIEEATVAIGEAVFDSFTSRAKDVVELVTRRGSDTDVAPDHGVYDGKRFFWRTPGTYGETLRMRLLESGSRVEDSTTGLLEIDSEGEDVGALGDRIVATFTDGAGKTRSVGYPGSGADYESEALVDTNPLNPLVWAQKPRPIPEAPDFGRVAPELALALAQVKLAESVANTRSGSYTVHSLPGGESPFGLHAGEHRLQIENHLADEQPILTTSWSLSAGTTRAEVGASSDHFDVAMARQQ